MSTDEHDMPDEMSSEFITEIKEDLASLEPGLLAMEEKGADVDNDLINHVFRSIHSIKGGAGFINFTALSDLSHVMENVLMRVREKTLVITPDIVDALLAGFDKMKSMVDTMGSGSPCDFEEQVSALKQILDTGFVSASSKNKTKKKSAPAKTKKKPVAKKSDKKTTPKKTSATQKKASKKQTIRTKKKPDQTNLVIVPASINTIFENQEFEIDKEKYESALAIQKFVYIVYLKLESSRKPVQREINYIIDDIKSIGEILYSDFDTIEQKEDTNEFFCVITTILDLPLLAQVLEIDTSLVSPVRRKSDPPEQPIKDAPPSDPETIVEPVDVEADEKEKKSSVQERETGAAVQDQNHQPSVFSTNQTIRVNVDLISKLMNRAGELVLSRNQLRPFMEEIAAEDSQAIHMMQNLDMVTTDIQEAIMQMRMQPIVDLMGKYKRVVRDIARRMSKKVDFILEGADVEVDRNILEKLANPLTHLVRNCIDHGIESPDQRLAAGKPETGKIHVKAYHQGGHVHINIKDDGAGIDPQLVLSKAFEKGLVQEDQIEKLTDSQKIDLIFKPGFSTSDKITDISGRGVGMDVVKTNIERLRGQLQIESEKGKGTSVHLIIPLTLAIVPSLIVRVGDARFAVPQVNIKEVLYLEAGQIHEQAENIAGSEILRVRERLIPVLRLRNVLQMQTYIKNTRTGEKQVEKRKAIADRRQKTKSLDTSDKRAAKTDRRKKEWDSTYVIVVKLGLNLFGICVEEVYEIEEVVVEPLPDHIKHLKNFSGTTILGDGSVIMILDIPGIAFSSSLSFDAAKAEKARQRKDEPKQTQANEELRSLIVFSNGANEYFALPLDSISRLEPLSASDVHKTGEKTFYETDKQAVLLFSMDEFLSASPNEIKEDEVFVLFPKLGETKVGILASTIVDTIETCEQLSNNQSCPDIISGQFFIESRMVQVLSPDKFFQQIKEKVAAEIGT